MKILFVGLRTYYDLRGKVLVDGTSEVVYRVTHTTLGKTVDTLLVSVSILKFPPVINAPLPVGFASPVKFTSTDDLNWRNAISKITLIFNQGTSRVIDHTNSSHHKAHYHLVNVKE